MTGTQSRTVQVRRNFLSFVAGVHPKLAVFIMLRVPLTLSLWERQHTLLRSVCLKQVARAAAQRDFVLLSASFRPSRRSLPLTCADLAAPAHFFSQG